MASSFRTTWPLPWRLTYGLPCPIPSPVVRLAGLAPCTHPRTSRMAWEPSHAPILLCLLFAACEILQSAQHDRYHGPG
ncbi:hypothetical protein Micbo1qcDRAFT_155876 [Microdochium bolleyi]|uniref:Uncharacterized protein n=1 Tax=Microdochium bolleyi TaxID=196109 RepID=A0A136JIZ3_9PEZI|nr:hypothetical protein Micbo1qcDRAFT_155876 [Microdochium bolleyi]